MSKIKDLRNAAVVTLAIGAAYGLGIISCVWWELKGLASIYKETKEDEQAHKN